MSRRSRGSYEPIGPSPTTGKTSLKYILIGVCIVGLISASIIVILKVTNNTSTSKQVVLNKENGGGRLRQDSTGAAVEEVAGREDVLVTLDLGTIRGKYLKSRAGRDYLAFQGVPYAQPPVGALRFQLPAEVQQWNGTYNATELKPDCIQKDKYNPEFVTKGSEDCLYLNIYTPKNVSELGKRRGRFPVMFYLHGGEPYGAGNKYGADYFMDEDVMLITFQNRLGVLGNLNTNDSEARGNQGLKDQAMALQWVQTHIQKFGGDKGKVTIFGHSYGAMEVTAHMLSPMSQDLFHRAIVQSGTIIQNGAQVSKPLDVAYDLAKKLNCTSRLTNSTSTDSSSEGEADDLSTHNLVECFRAVDVNTLVLQSFLMEFLMSLEPPSNDSNVFFTDAPLNLLQSGQLNPVPVMLGTGSGERLYSSLPILSSPNLTRYFNENWENASIEALQLEKASDPIKIVNAAKEFYLGGQNVSRELQPNLTDMFSDRGIVHSEYVFATAQLEVNSRRQKVFLYYFNKEADKTYAQPFLDMYGNDTGFLGAAHADELQFLFPYEPYPTIPEGSKNANFSKMLVKLWTTFADSGKPTDGDSNVEWEAIEDPKPFRWFLIEDEPKMVDFLGPRMNFWDQFNLTDLYQIND